MFKFFVSENQIEGNLITILGSDVNHISKVLRMQKSDKVKIGDKETLQTYLAQIREIEKDKIILEKLKKIEETTEPNVEIDLFQGLPKSDKMELIIQKTVEIGVSNIIPVDMVRCVVKLDEKDTKKKIDRWKKIAEVAAKQSKRDKIPQIQNKIKLKEIIEKINKYDTFIVAYEEETQNYLKQELQKLKHQNQYKIGILIGPEGGISKEEIQLLKQNKAKIITLGKRILRTETAPIVTLSNILYELEN